MTISRDQLKALRKELSALVSHPDIIRVLVADAGLPLASIDMHGAPEIVWHNVLDEAVKRDRMQPLLHEISERYPSSQLLRRLLDLSVPPSYAPGAAPSYAAGNPPSHVPGSAPATARGGTPGNPLSHVPGNAPANAPGGGPGNTQSAPGSGAHAVSDTRKKIFISYNREDRKYVEELRQYLNPLEKQGLLTLWDDSQIQPGVIWRQEIDRQLAAARFAVLMVSPDFLASDSIMKEEIPPLLRASASGRLMPLLVFVRPSMAQYSIHDYPDPATGAIRKVPLTAFQGLNKPDRPLSSLSAAQREEALLEIANRLVEAVLAAQEKTPPPAGQAGGISKVRSIPEPEPVMPPVATDANGTVHSRFAPPQNTQRQPPPRDRQARAASIVKVLFVAANPLQTDQLELGKEMKEIQESLRRSRRRHRFRFTPCFVETWRELCRVVMESDATILHFSGHGELQEGIMLADDRGDIRSIPWEVVADLFTEASNHLECVILNTCYSAGIRETLAEHIDYIVGSSNELRDSAAREFAIAFYDALGRGVGYPSAFRSAQIQVAGENQQQSQLLFLDGRRVRASQADQPNTASP